jgi:diguanylate cyclase (GGDEF)-like protein
MVGVSTFSTIGRLGTMPEQLFKHSHSVRLALNEIRSDVLLMQSQLSGLAGKPSQLKLRRFKLETAAAEERVERNLAIVEERFLGDIALFSAMRATFDAWRPVRDRVIEAIRSGDEVAAYTISKTEGAGQIAEVNARLDALIIETAVQTKRLNRDARDIRWRLILENGIILLGVLIGMLGVMRLIGGSLIEPTLDISAAMRRVADGDLLSAIPYTERADEIGEIARSAQVFLDNAVALQKSRFDLLTGLPTRRQLQDHIDVVLTDPETSAHAAALLHIDIDAFGEFNDGYGREAGDAMLTHVADILRGHMRLGDFLARDAADSFILLALGRSDLTELSEMAQQIRREVEQPIDQDLPDKRVSCSIGISVCNPATPADEMLAEAENALTEGRKAGRGTVEIYTEEMDLRLRRRREVLTGLIFGLKKGEIVPFYQPQIQALTGELCGFEALVRWNHPELGVLSPWEFVDVAQSAGLLHMITDAMIGQSVEQLAAWRRRGLNVPRVSLNFAASDLRRPDFVDNLMLQVERVNLTPEDVCIELLETTMIEDAEDPVTRTLARLGDIGFPIELDDFGTGHAAISTLHLVKLSGIKIDRSFIADLNDRPEHQHLTRGILRISNALQISSVAEGVETAEQRAMLIDLGCEMLQGFAIAPPMSAPEATEWLECYDPSLHAEPVAAIA